MNFIEQDGNYRLLEEAHINERTLISWHNEDDGIISIALFSKTQSNALSRRVSQSQWGYATKFITNISTTEEAAQVAGLYLKDMKDMNFWWEHE